MGIFRLKFNPCSFPKLAAKIIPPCSDTKDYGKSLLSELGEFPVYIAENRLLWETCLSHWDWFIFHILSLNSSLQAATSISLSLETRHRKGFSIIVKQV
ncbi:hypothetical protein BDGGKGIB_01228 [Nodularia sphaerocarpa UHCC 0038]|nr:hypothetical protein BDGGKGIB_01228 [Nodularia sphaerocarpa UHCC 0038]